jgi:RNase P subunit RPR2
MRCQRCRGLLVPESFGDLNIETHSLRMAIRCINCGVSRMR